MAYSTLGALRRADQVFFEQVSERETLDHGLAFYAPDYPSSPGENAFREVVVPDATIVAEVYEITEAWYAQHGLRCLRWIPALGQEPDVLESELASHGWIRRDMAAMRLAVWPDDAQPADVRILPARAMRRGYRTMFEGEAAADLAEQRLDYAQYDAFVAVRDGRVLGACGLLQAGEVAEVRDIMVLPDERRSGVGRTLALEAMGLARRLLMRSICTRVGSDDADGRAFLSQLGFEEDGVFVEFDRNT
jgi:GNAT superfamily N-acetyltransferase